MARILKQSSDVKREDRSEKRQLHYVDLRDEIASELEAVHQQSQAILEAARQEAVTIRREAMETGRSEAEQAFQQRLDEALETRLSGLTPALEQAVREIRQEKTRQLRQMERGIVQLAVAIAERLVRRELAHSPDIPLDLIREALDLAVGNERIKLHLHPVDHETLGEHLEVLTARLSDSTNIELVTDPQIEPGGCVVKTDFGTIDQQFSTQLERVVEELI